MTAPLWILIGTFAAMIAALVADRAAAAAAAPAPVAAPVPAPAAAASADLADLSAAAEGWALVAPDGHVAATNLPERAALLAGACAVLRLASGAEAALPWHTVTLEGPAGVLLGEASPHGAVLAVLARREADVEALRARMGHALAEFDRHLPALGRAWDDGRSLGAAEPPPVAVADPVPGEAFVPLD